MYGVTVAQSDGNKLTPTKGDTLASIAASDECERGTTWQRIALYNWGTTDANEVNRALIELVGCATVDVTNPEKSVLDPDLGTTKAIYVPKVWTPPVSLAVEKTHTVKLRKRLPAPAAVLTKVDPWFIPETESCDVGYRIEGVAERADKLDFDVYASSYCKATPTAYGDFFKYAFAPVDVPIRQKREFTPATARKADTITDWKGESEATDGILKPRAPETKRYVDVACSPYTVLVRYYKAEADKDARVTLKTFWPRFKKILKTPSDTTGIDGTNATDLKAKTEAALKAARELEAAVRLADADVVAYVAAADLAALKAVAASTAADQAVPTLATAKAAAATAKSTIAAADTAHTTSAVDEATKTSTATAAAGGSATKAATAHENMQKASDALAAAKTAAADAALKAAACKTSATDVATKADAAKTKADEAKSAAAGVCANVKDPADAAATKAATAKTKADELKTAATTASTSANTCRDDAATAATTGKGARDDSATMSASAGKASRRFARSHSSWGAAKTESTTAATMATSAKGKADQTKTDAATLKTSANTAKTDAGKLALAMAPAKSEAVALRAATDATDDHVVYDKSLEVTWKVEKTTRIKHGQLIIVDKDGKAVFRKPLADTDLEKDTEITCKPAADDHAKYWLDGKTKLDLAPSSMPYRAQLQVHSAWDEVNGVALAAMHTEVRLWTHKDLGADPDPVAQPQCFDIEIAPFIADETLAKKDGSAAEKNRFAKLKMAKAGYHPGPVDDDVARDAFKVAIKELKRANAKAGATRTRLTVDEVVDHADTLGVLDALAERQRPLFGKADDRTDLDTDAANALLKDKDKEIVVWVDDRHTFTDITADGFATRPTDLKMEMGGYRGGMALGDRASKDAESIPAPWLPLQVGLALLAKSDALEGTAKPTLTDPMRRAIGPIRVDWTFNEIGEDLDVIVNTSGYDPAYARTRKYIEKTTKESPATKHNDLECTNCTVPNGGIRPTSIDAYHSVPFGLDKDSLHPWLTVKDDTDKKKCVYTMVHEDLGQDVKKVYEKARGRAGAYLKLSRIAGDGYRFRAKVGFGQVDAKYLLPNHEILEGRYPKLPQAQTCKLRLWRKASWRAYVAWTGSSHWGRAAECATLYKPAFHHIVDDTAGSSAPGTLLTEAAYKDIVAAQSVGAAWKDKSKMALNGTHVWPWYGQDHFGVETVPAPGVSIADYNTTHMNPIVENTFWKFHHALCHGLIAKIEATTGKLLGHTLIEWSPIDDHWVRGYQCSVCKKKHLYVEKTDSATTANGKACKQTPSCAGTLGAAHDLELGCSSCAWTEWRVSSDATGAALVGTACPDCAATTVVVNNSEAQVSQGPSHFDLVGQADSLGGTTVIEWCDGAYWAHEFGHSKHMEHAASAPGWERSHHDSESNSHVEWNHEEDTCDQGCGEVNTNAYSGTPEACSVCGSPTTTTGRIDQCGNGHTVTRGTADAVDDCPTCSDPMTELEQQDTCDQGCGHVLERKASEGAGDCPECGAPMSNTSTRTHNDDELWDRCCIMSYTSPDVLYFCGKCVLKLRGWNVNALSSPAGTETGP